MDFQPQRKLHFHENDEDSRENNENSIVNDEGNASVHLWESIELQNMDDTLEIDGEEEIRNVYGLQENICQAQENFMERSTSLQALSNENQLMKIKSHFSGLSLDNSKLNESLRNTCCNTSDCQETKVSDKISGQEQLNTVQKITRKQMPCEGLPKVVPNDPNLKCIDTCHICWEKDECQHEKVCGRINVQEPLNVVKKISTWRQMPYEGIPKVFPGDPNPKCNETCRELCWETLECEETKDCERINVQEQSNTVKEMSTRKQMPLEGLPKVDRTLCYDFVLPGVPLYLRNTCWKTSDRQKLVTK